MNDVATALMAAKPLIDKLDAQYLLCHILQVSRASLIAHAERILTAEQSALFTAQLAARRRGVPVAQIIGKREFYGRDFYINAHVLIPRPETELLVTLALASVSSNKWLEKSANASVCDLGTGSGAIAITLALESPSSIVTAIDQSHEAIAVAKKNAANLNADVRFVMSDWYHALAGQQFNIIVANPPYIAKDDPHLLMGDLRFEPTLALTDNSDDGLGAIRTIIINAPRHLTPGGRLLIEHGFDQAERARAIFTSAGFTDVESTNDLAGIARVTLGTFAD